MATAMMERGVKARARKQAESGFSLIEVMISMVVLTIGLLAVLATLGVTMAATQTSQEDMIARQVASEAMESIFNARNTSQLGFAAINNTTAVPPGVSPASRFEAIWAKIIATFETYRPLWVANFEIFAQMVGQPATRGFLAGNLHTARVGLAAMFLDQEESAVSQHTAATTGTFLHVLLSGLILQWLLDPASALSAKGLTEALRVTAQGLQPARKTTEPQRKRAHITQPAYRVRKRR